MRRIRRATVQPPRRPGRRRRLVGLAVVLLTLLATLLYVPSRHTGLAQWSRLLLPDLDLEQYQRILVLSPHCDDETLGAGGLLLQARRLGIPVQVVFATNGDGFYFETAEEFRRLMPRPHDYIEVGHKRQQEALRAVAALGVPADQVTFLGYPDRGLVALWNDHWRRESPYRSPYTGTTSSPYHATFDPAARYAGEDLLANLVRILRTDRPDLVLLPHPHDLHPDHFSLSVFAQLALRQVEEEDATYRPDRYAYLVHRVGFPYPRGLRPDDALLPPGNLWDQYAWFRRDLDEAETAAKWHALQQYRSQLRIPRLGPLLRAFVRRNEVFSDILWQPLPHLDAVPNANDPGSWRDLAGQAVEPVVRDAERDTVGQDLVGGADLGELFAGLTPDGGLALAVRLRGRVQPSFDYVLRATVVGPDGVRQVLARRLLPRRHAARATARGNVVGVVWPAADVGRARQVYVSASVTAMGGRAGELQLATIDRSGWQELLAEPPR